MNQKIHYSRNYILPMVGKTNLVCLLLSLAWSVAHPHQVTSTLGTGMNTSLWGAGSGFLRTQGRARCYLLEM